MFGFFREKKYLQVRGSDAYNVYRNNDNEDEEDLMAPGGSNLTEEGSSSQDRGESEEGHR